MSNTKTPAAALSDWCGENRRALVDCVSIDEAAMLDAIEEVIVSSMPREIGEVFEWSDLVARVRRMACHMAS